MGLEELVVQLCAKLHMNSIYLQIHTSTIIMRESIKSTKQLN